jgi:ankyrin repeat protein
MTFLLLIVASFSATSQTSPSSEELSAAIKKADIESVRTLLKGGAPVKTTDRSGFMPLVSAAIVAGRQPQALEIIDLLLAAGADIEQEGPTDITPLYAAVTNGPPAVVTHLLDKGANVNAQVGDGRTALYQSVRRGTVRAAEVLIQRGANVNDKTAEGWVPLHLAAINGLDSTVELLLANGASVNARDGEGKTPLAWAKGNGPKHIGGSRAKPTLIEILVKSGAIE